MTTAAALASATLAVGTGPTHATGPAGLSLEAASASAAAPSVDSMPRLVDASAPSRLDVRVVVPDGFDAQHSRVTLRQQGTYNEWVAEIDTDGIASIDLGGVVPRGNLEICVTHLELAPKCLGDNPVNGQRFTLAEGRHEATVVLELPSVLRGRVTVPDGYDITKVSVTALYDQKITSPGYLPYFGWTGGVAADGTYEIPQLAAGDYIVVAHTMQHTLGDHYLGGSDKASATRFSLGVNETRVLPGQELKELHALRGTVALPAGMTSDDVWVMASPAGERTGSTTATMIDHSGGYAFYGLAPGNYHVAVHPKAGAKPGWGASTFYPGTRHQSEARVVRVGETPVSGIDFTMRQAGEVVSTSTQLAVSSPAPGRVALVARVSPAASGTVWFFRGQKLLSAPVPVVNGVARLTLDGQKGRVGYEASFVPADLEQHRPSVSRTVAVDVMAAKRRATLRGTTARHLTKSKSVRVSGRVTGPEVRPTGRVKVVLKRGSKTVRTSTVRVTSTGTYALRWRKVTRPGPYTVKITYAGDSRHTKARSVTKRFRIR